MTVCVISGSGKLCSGDRVVVASGRDACRLVAGAHGSGGI